MGSANDGRRYIVRSSLIGRAHAQKDHWHCYAAFSLPCRLRRCKLTLSLFGWAHTHNDHCHSFSAFSFPCKPNIRWVVVAMCYSMGICNYLMRANLSVAMVCMNSDPFEMSYSRSANNTNGLLTTISGNTKTEVDTSIIKVSMQQRAIAVLNLLYESENSTNTLAIFSPY